MVHSIGSFASEQLNFNFNKNKSLEKEAVEWPIFKRVKNFALKEFSLFKRVKFHSWKSEMGEISLF